MTIAEKLSSVANTKKAIKEAIISKGVDVLDSDAFAVYPNKIRSISTGAISAPIPNMFFGTLLETGQSFSVQEGLTVVPPAVLVTSAVAAI